VQVVPFPYPLLGLLTRAYPCHEPPGARLSTLPGPNPARVVLQGGLGYDKMVRQAEAAVRLAY